MNSSRYSIVLCYMFFAFSVQCSFAQSGKTDSLQKAYNNAKSDQLKIDLLNALFIEYEFSDQKKAEELLKQAEQLSGKIDYKKGLANTYLHLGYLAQDRSNTELANHYYNASLKISEASKNKAGIEANLCNIGNIYFEQRNFPKALECFFKALKLSEELGNKQQVAALLGNIGGVYLRQTNYSKSLEYYSEALKIDESLGNKNEIPPDLNNISIIYYSQKNYVKALDFSFRALKIVEELGNKNGIASCLGSIANIYSDMGENASLPHVQQDSLTNMALNYYQRALKRYEELDNKNGIAIQLSNIGSLYITTKHYKEAEEYLIKVLAIDSVIGFREHSQNTLAQLSALYEKTNKPEKALAFYKKYTEAKDSVYNETQSKQIAEMQTKYDLANKEKELALLKKENEIAEYKKFLLISGLVFVILLALLFISRQRIKIRKQREAHLMEQNLVQKELERKQLETRNLETDVQLKQEKLNNYTNLLLEKTKVLDKLQEQLDEMKNKNSGTEMQTAENLLANIKESIDPNEYWEEFITNFNLVYKDFLDQLKAEFPDLTRNELRLCALLRCNLGNKEIANILSIGPDSVKKARNRIRKKLELDATENLTEFILGIN